MIQREFRPFDIPGRPGVHTIKMPLRAGINSIGPVEFRTIRIWATVDPAKDGIRSDEDDESRNFLVVGDKEPYTCRRGVFRFLGTCYFEAPSFMVRAGVALHVFEVG